MVDHEGLLFEKIASLGRAFNFQLVFEEIEFGHAVIALLGLHSIRI